MKVILIGGKGFIGEYLTQKLLGKKYQVFVVDKDSSLKDIQDFSAEVVVVMTQPNRGVLDSVISLTQNSKSIKKILYLSTLLLYPDSKDKLNEKVIPDPKTIYEKDKYSEELLLSDVIKQVGCKLCIARLSNVYGDIKNKGIINILLTSLIKNRSILTIHKNSLTKIRDYIFIEDAVNLLEFLIFFDQKKQIDVFNICTGRGYNLKQLIKKLELIAGKKVDFKIDSPNAEKVSNIGDNKKILDLLNYKIKYSLTKGLIKTYENYLKHEV